MLSGIEDDQMDTNGDYICQHLGNLECQVSLAIINRVLMENTLSQDGFTPQCSGLGVIDCTGECAGTREEFKQFIDVMEDKYFDKKFPEMAKARVWRMENGEWRWEGVKKRFMNSLLKCTNFSQEAMAILNGKGGEVF